MKPAGGRPPFRVEPLDRQHERRSFHSACAPLDDYLHRRALQDQRRQVSVCHVLVAPASPARILGYYTLSTYSVRLGELPPDQASRLPRYPAVPAVLLGRLAVDREVRGEGLGELLLLDALHRCFTRVAAELGVYAVVAHAKHEAAAAFYRRYGFLALPSAPLTLFLPMATIAELFAGC